MREPEIRPPEFEFKYVGQRKSHRRKKNRSSLYYHHQFYFSPYFHVDDPRQAGAAEFIERVTDWCRANLGVEWTRQGSNPTWYFGFRNDSDAALFKLFWC